MKSQARYVILCVFWFFCLGLQAQISPGKLASSHAHLEGVSNCTQCHDLGNKVPDNKCLDCHKEIQSLINFDRGYHASTDVASKTCVDCHSDHHGRKFEMTRFDEDKFDHQLTGYSLEQQHAVIDCRACHISENIADPDIKKRDGTFLGLTQNCTSCHEDFHQGTLDNDCRSCHDIAAFRPAVNFDHVNTDFSLEGAHGDVSCVECHEKTVKNGKEFQVFKDVKHNDCIDCHSDPHNDLPGNCTQCHTTFSFNTFVGARNFNHNLTSFTLIGKHRSTQCFQCHSAREIAANIFQDHKDVANKDCVACHQDTHDGKFGSHCINCHTEEGWNLISNLNSFDHNLTDYPLVGMHIGVDCKACHVEESYTEPIDFQYCRNCHQDYHNGEFTENGLVKDCNTCHVIDKSFSYTTFSSDEHNLTAFPLEGAHLATPCFACHVSEDHWSFKNMGTNCKDCHIDIHENYIDEKYYPDQNCISCHSTESWADIEFDHSATSWKLDGKHKEVSCRTCHFEEIVSSGTDFRQSFVYLSSNCASCHENVHDEQFEIEGITDCKRCHVSSTWVPENFDHSNTKFELTGKHKELDCIACHKPDETAEGRHKVLYKISSFECIDCHF